MSDMHTPQTADKAVKLVKAADRISFDPMEDIDWSKPIDDDTLHLPEKHLPLYGTRIWEEMTEGERYRYSKHEAANLCGAGIWFENILMGEIVKHMYELEATDPSHRYLLVEVADECRHSSMFAEWVERAGTPAYRPARWLRAMGRLMRYTSGRPAAYMAILAAEELLDASNRDTMRDSAVHPTSRRIAKIHVMEEARHVSFARTFLAEAWPQLNLVEKGWAMAAAPVIVWHITRALINPAVYEELGIEDGYRSARTNPIFKAQISQDLRKLTDFLTDLGVINRATRPIWRFLGLLGDRHDVASPVATAETASEILADAV